MFLHAMPDKTDLCTDNHPKTPRNVENISRHVLKFRSLGKRRRWYGEKWYVSFAIKNRL
jgi:hypothetical protein